MGEHKKKREREKEREKVRVTVKERRIHKATAKRRDPMLVKRVSRAKAMLNGRSTKKSTTSSSDLNWG